MFMPQSVWMEGRPFPPLLKENAVNIQPLLCLMSCCLLDDVLYWYILIMSSLGRLILFFVKSLYVASWFSVKVKYIYFFLLLLTAKQLSVG